jgi:hypothetical protein
VPTSMDEVLVQAQSRKGPSTTALPNPISWSIMPIHTVPLAPKPSRPYPSSPNPSRMNGPRFPLSHRTCNIWIHPRTNKQTQTTRETLLEKTHRERMTREMIIFYSQAGGSGAVPATLKEESDEDALTRRGGGEGGEGRGEEEVVRGLLGAPCGAPVAVNGIGAWGGVGETVSLHFTYPGA